MALEIVEITIEDEVPPHAPLEDVVVRVYDSTGTTLLTEGLTDDDGKVSFLLNGEDAPDPERYQIRTYKAGTSSPQPKYIEVFSPPSSAPTSTNTFLIRASVFTHPSAVDPNLCRVSGYIRDPAGRPKAGIDIHFVYRFNPLVVEGQGVLGERVSVRTDKQGYVQVDLWRKGCYRAIIESHENVGRNVEVPDLPSVNIMHLLFPRVYGVTFDPPAPWTVAVGAELLITVQTELTSGYVLDSAATDDLVYSLADNGVVSASVSDKTLKLRGLAAGSTSLNITRVDQSIIYVPDNAVVGNDSSITVA